MSRVHQKGTAIVTALLVVALVAGIATWLISQQSRALTRTARTIEHAQVQQYLGPTLDWARAALLESLRGATWVSRDQRWAEGIAAQPVEDALAGGVLTDEGGKFNLNNLVNEGKASDQDIAVFKRLLAQLKLEPQLAEALVDWLDSDGEMRPDGAEDGYYLGLPNPYRAANRTLVLWQELARVRGFGTGVMQRLAPYVTVLPVRNRININTATPTLIAAVFPDLTNAERNALVEQREKTPFRNMAEVHAQAALKKAKPGSIDALVDVDSAFFQVTVNVSGAGVSAAQTALLQRGQPGANAWPRIVWRLVN